MTVGRGIAERFGISVLGNVAKAGFSFLTALVLAKGFGPEKYGIYIFLVSSFIALSSLLDLGSSSAFFTFISRKPRPKSFFCWYFLWMLMQLLAFVVVIGLVMPDKWVSTIWHDNDRYLVIKSFIAIFFMQQVWGLVSQLAEAHRETAKFQAINIMIAAAHFVIVLILSRQEGVAIDTIFIIIFIEYILSIILFSFVININFSNDEENKEELFADFLKYCRPLVLYSLIGLLASFIDTWMLQRYGGASQQAFFSIGMQFSAISLIATRSILRIFWKEVAEAFENDDMARVQSLQHRVGRTMYQFSSLLACFLIPWISEILPRLMGAEYVGAAGPLVIMLLYPLHQSLGQVTMSLYYAVGETRKMSTIMIVMMISGAIVSYFLLANNFGLIPDSLEATVLAIKFVFVQFLTVNILIFAMARTMFWAYDWRYQIVVPTILLGLGYVARGVAAAGDPWLDFPLQIALSSAFYFLICFALLLRAPQVFGFSAKDIESFRQTAKNYIGRIAK